MLSRLPIRTRLTLAFTGLMALVLVAIGAFVYLRFAADLDDALNTNLKSRAADVAALVQEADSGLSEGTAGRFIDRGESFAEIVDRHGRIFDSTPQVGQSLLLSRDQLRQAARATIRFDRGPLLDVHDQARLLATPIHAQGRDLIVVVGISTGARSDSLESLLTLLVIGGPIALLLASAAAYWVAGAALRPVEAMRSRAAQVSAEDPSQRLPVPVADDEIARLGSTLNAMLERLGAALDRQRDFVADASHELRTPLAVLKAELELALKRGRSREELEAALTSAAEETDRLTQLAEALLVIAQSDQGQLPVKRTPTRVADVLDDIGRRFSRRASEAGRSLQTSADPGLSADLDRLRIEQALGNMVDNALRYGEGLVTLTAKRENGRLELHVLDQGPGFSQGFRSRAFERFTRADGRGSRGGAGLGLAIVDSIARSHQGHAGARNRDEGGADVWVEIPLPRG